MKDKKRSPLHLSIGSLLLLLSATACEVGSSFIFPEDQEVHATQTGSSPAEESLEVAPQIIGLAAAALPEAWPKGAEAVELRILPERIEIRGGFVPKDDVVATAPPQAFLLTFSCSAQAECGFSDPQPARLSESGIFTDNLFPLSKIHLAGIARSLGTARKSVDPERGRVTEIKARRFLPFSKAVRVRYYVDSPLMAGTMDANGRGIPLKR